MTVYAAEWGVALGVAGVAAVFVARRTGGPARDLIAAGCEAIVGSVDLPRLDGSLAGRRFETGCLADLQPEVDPCGEKGAFHTFVFNAPNFSNGLPVSIGAFAERDLHSFRELAPPADCTARSRIDDILQPATPPGSEGA